MIGIIVGSIALIGLARFARHRHCYAHGHHYLHHHRDHEPSARGRFGGRHRRRGYRAGIDYLVDRLDASPEQEETLRAAAREFMGTVRDWRGEKSRTRDDLAGALRADDVDAEMMGEMFSRHDDALRDLRGAFVALLSKIHTALEPDQREELARMVESGSPLRWGPYR